MAAAISFSMAANFSKGMALIIFDTLIVLCDFSPCVMDDLYLMNLLLCDARYKNHSGYILKGYKVFLFLVDLLFLRYKI
jgi:hypothetical protein